DDAGPLVDRERWHLSGRRDHRAAHWRGRCRARHRDKGLRPGARRRPARGGGQTEDLGRPRRSPDRRAPRRALSAEGRDPQQRREFPVRAHQAEADGAARDHAGLVARRAASSRRRGATPAIEPRIRDEIGAIAVLAFALLSTVALATDQGAVLQWWRSALFSLLGWAAWLVPLALGAIALELWFGFIRRDTVLPILGGVVIVVALLGLTRHYVRDDVAGGFVGGALAKAVAGLFGEIGAPIALGALLLVGIVIAANRTIADLWEPVWRQRPSIGGLKPGTLIPGGTATRFDRFFEDDGEPEAAEPVRIHIPEEKPA